MSASGYMRCPHYRPFSRVSRLRTQLMTAYGSECFTMNEVNRLKILQDVIDGRLTTSLASQRLGITDRHCQHVIASPGRWLWRTAAGDCVVIASFFRALLNLLCASSAITMPTLVPRSPARSWPSSMTLCWPKRPCVS